MRIVSFGDLYCDYYFKNDILQGVMGGKSNANILANLSKYYDTCYIGITTNDSAGILAKSTLEELNIDVSHINIIDGNCKKFFISEDGYTQVCPYCNRDLSYKGIKTKSEYVIPYLKEDDILIIDSLNDLSLEVLEAVDNMAFLDIGYVGNLRFLSLDEIIDIIGNRFKIININEKVYDYFKNKFSIDSVDLYNYLKPDILIITRGKKGVDIIYNGEFEKKEIENPAVEVDSNGAGDAFFSEFIHIYLEDKAVDARMISKAYIKASTLSRRVVSKLGARTHLIPLKRIKQYKECICSEFEYL